MGYEKIMGLPHPTLQMRRLKRLQNQQTECLGGVSDLLKKKSYTTRKTTQPTNEIERRISQEPDHNTIRKSFNLPQNDLSENAKISSNESIHIDEGSLPYRRQKRSLTPNSSISLSSTTSRIQVNSQRSRNSITRYLVCY